MTIQRQLGFWAVATVAAVLLLLLLRDVLLPFVAGFVLAYLLDPVADWFERRGFGRLGATLVILVLFVLVLMLALVLLVPLAARQLSLFVEGLPALVSRLQALLAEQGAPILERIGGQDALADMQRSVGDLVQQGTVWIGAFLRSLWSGGQAIISIFALLVVTPVGPSTSWWTGTGWCGRSTAGSPCATGRPSGSSPGRSTGPSRGSSEGRRRCACFWAPSTPWGSPSSG
jgi:predicted PurR-regulated permease PerM